MKAKQTSCEYCANAQKNHKLEYIASFLSVNVDPHIARVTKYAPKFVKDFVDFIPSIIFPILGKLGIAKFLSDIEGATTLRSRVIWEEAKRRGIEMQQIALFGKSYDSYRAKINGKYIYFQSLPIPPSPSDGFDPWDNKSTLKYALEKNNIPAPRHREISVFKNTRDIFSSFQKPIIVKPRTGSRGRHTTTNINTLEEFEHAIKIGGQISPYLIVEEHLRGDVYRATFINGKLAGFYRGSAPSVIGDGRRTIRELIEEKNKNKPERVSLVETSGEIESYIARSGLSLDSMPKSGERVQLTYRTGRLFGGVTREMIDALHPSFLPIFERLGEVVDIAVAGFDCIILDPESDASSQRWGIIECNTLPFIDLHYYALEGKPRNIAGMIWDLWDIEK